MDKACPSPHAHGPPHAPEQDTQDTSAAHRLDRAVKTNGVMHRLLGACIIMASYGCIWLCLLSAGIIHGFVALRLIVYGLACWAQASSVALLST